MSRLRNVSSPFERLPYHWRTCSNERCGEAFVSQNPTQRYCGINCGHSTRARRHYARHRVTIPRLRDPRTGQWVRRVAA